MVYDCSWKGLISSAEPGADFGNSNYNDHHFHYGYHVHAIAILSHIDQDWLHANNDLIFNYANTLIRDVASPQADQYFPQFRSFDFSMVTLGHMVFSHLVMVKIMKVAVKCIILLVPLNYMVM